ncbi:uncharacterized protein METZ01_LOCUS484106, partial [marine metagenome]
DVASPAADDWRSDGRPRRWAATGSRRRCRDDPPADRSRWWPGLYRVSSPFAHLCGPRDHRPCSVGSIGAPGTHAPASTVSLVDRTCTGCCSAADRCRPVRPGIRRRQLRCSATSGTGSDHDGRRNSVGHRRLSAGGCGPLSWLASAADAPTGTGTHADSRSRCRASRGGDGPSDRRSPDRIHHSSQIAHHRGAAGGNPGQPARTRAARSAAPAGVRPDHSHRLRPDGHRCHGWPGCASAAS